MSRGSLRVSIPVFVLILVVLSSVPAFAGSAVIGLVAGSSNATVGGRVLVPNTTIFSGDTIQVKNGVAVVAVGGSSRMAFGRDTLASFLRDPDEVTVLLSRGNVSLYHPDDGVAVRVKVEGISVVPVSGFKTVGEVAMIEGTLIVTAREGLLRVEGNGSTAEVAKGKTLTVPAKPSKAPTGAAAGGIGHISSSLALNITSAALAGVGAVEGGVAISRANDAKDAAIRANATAGQAVTAANAATTAATAATTAATAANTTAASAGCALNTLNNTLNPGTASPFTPPTGVTCK